MSLAILGLGTSVPPCPLTQDLAAEMTSMVSGHSADQARRLAILYRRAGIRRRHVAILDEGAVLPEALQAGTPQGPSTRWRMQRYEDRVGPVARQATQRALADAGVAASAISHLVTVSCTGFAAPGFDLALMRDLGLDPSVPRTHVGFMGCHGALNGIRVARAFAAAEGPEARVLLCAAELCSLHFGFGWEADRAVPNALFADGAAAVVAAQAPAGEGTEVWRAEANGSYLVPGTEDAMSWRIGDHGFEMTLSPQLGRLIGTHLRPWLEGWLARQDLALGDVASWAVHPGGPRVLDAVEEALALGKDVLADSRAVLADYGNMSSPTVLFILDRLIRRDAPRPCIALAFGPGFVIEVLLFI